MKFAIGKMSVGDILDRGIKLLLARFGTFYGIMFIVSLPILILELSFPNLYADPSQALFGSFLNNIIGTILQQIGTGAACYVVAQEFVDRHVGVGDALSFAFRRAVPLILAAFLVGLIVGLGLVFCLAPGFLFLTWYAFASQAVVVEGLGATDALSRSKQLSEGHRWRILGVILLIMLLTLGVIVLAVALQFVLPFNEVVQTQFTSTVVFKSYFNYAINMIFVYTLAALIGSYQVICLTLLYFDLRIRKEGFDLEMAAQQQMAVK